SPGVGEGGRRAVGDAARDGAGRRGPAGQQPERVDAVGGGRVGRPVTDETHRRGRSRGAGAPCRDEVVRAVEQRQQCRRLLAHLGQEDSLRDVHAAGSPTSASATWQATRRRGPMSRRSGVTVSHSATAYGQRRRKRQPSPGLITRGGSPTSAASAIPSGARGSGNAERRSCVDGCFGRRRTSSIGPSSTRCPAYMTSTRSAMYRALATSCVM